MAYSVTSNCSSDILMFLIANRFWSMSFFRLSIFWLSDCFSLSLTVSLFTF